MLISHENIYLQNHSNSHAGCMVTIFTGPNEYISPLFSFIYLPCTTEPSIKWPHLPSHLRLPRGPCIGATRQDFPHSALETNLEYLCYWFSVIPLPELIGFWKNRRKCAFLLLKSSIYRYTCLSKSIGTHMRTNNTQILEGILVFLSLLDPN